MTIARRRSKIVAFRLFEEEYEAIQGLCDAEGAGSFSDLARLAIRKLQCGCGPGEESIDAKLLTLCEIVGELRREVSRLADLVQKNGSSIRVR